MNILFISALEGGKYSGPLYSVPKQIESQASYDKVYWVNLTKINKDYLDSVINCNIINIKDFSLEKLPKPFNMPDLVVFEEFFKIENALIAKKLIRNSIPYIIIPRCQMTTQYLKNKWLKKKVARILLFNKFAKYASKVQFLTKQEYQDSKKYYKGSYFVIPNGIVIPKMKARLNKKDIIKGTFIGRYSIVQKGLDILIEAIEKEKDILRSNNIKFQLYGPDERTGMKSKIDELANKYDISDIINVNSSVFGYEKEKILLESDFFVHTSRFEGLPMSVLEALAYGLPCLVTDGSNLRKEIENTASGWGATTDVEGVSYALKNLVNSLDSLSMLGKNARSLAITYSWNEIAKQSHDIYVELKSSDNH